MVSIQSTINKATRDIDPVLYVALVIGLGAIVTALGM